MRKTNLFFIVFGFLIVWQILSIGVNRVIYPNPIDIIVSFKDADYLFKDIVISFIRLIIGSSLGIVSAIIYGLFTGHFDAANKTVGKISNFLRFIPPLALVPLFLVWFGIGELSKILLLAWTTFFPVWISTHNGVRNIEKKYLLVAQSLSVKKFYFIKDFVLKGAMEYIINGARIGVGITFSVLIAAEMIGAYAGLGYRIFFYQSVYRMDIMIGYIVIIGILGIMTDKCFRYLSKRLTPWKKSM